MTGFASLKGHLGSFSWAWDMRAVNARGLDIRLRVPDWIDGLEGVVRKAVGAGVGRGSVSVSLRVQREGNDATMHLNRTALSGALDTLVQISHAAENHGLVLTPTTAADVAAMRGVLETSAPEEDTAPLLAALTADLPVLLNAFNAMRATEGAALNTVLESQLAQIDDLVVQAAGTLEDRRSAQADGLRDSLARVLDNVDRTDADRVAQELALIAVKTDVREEIDRLEAHVTAARDLLAGQGPRGRKLDFLTQEFNREANTLCSKAQFQALTRIGLDLKAVIDQMREQVQNVE